MFGGYFGVKFLLDFLLAHSLQSAYKWFFDGIIRIKCQSRLTASGLTDPG